MAQTEAPDGVEPANAPGRAPLVLGTLILVSGVANLDQLTAAAKTSFLQGDDWAYSAGAIAVLLGAVLVFFCFPRKEAEEQLLRDYAAQDS